MFNWTIIVADDGSTDGTIEYMESLDIEVPIIIIKNRRVFVARQTNSIFEVCRYLDYDFGFKVDDDVYFVQKGWDTDYIDAYCKYGFAHIVHYNPEHLAFRKRVMYGDLMAPTDAIHCMGCLFTFIPEIFDKVGYFDDITFTRFGHAHQEWTIRCCRAGYNDSDNVYDIKNSYHKVKLKSPQTEHHYITHKGNVNIENWKRLLDVWKDPSVIYKSHKEQPKNITMINSWHINGNITTINHVDYINRPSVENKVTVVSTTESMIKLLYDVLRIIGYTDVEIYLNLSDSEMFHSSDREILFVDTDVNNMDHTERIHNILSIIYELKLGRDLSARSLELVHECVAG